ncbi:MAG: SMC-Scp complex subunit ScpB [Candidatus Ryanbacteria bacterium]|nr:SMC-Scp complex subunit ScpB [Candidatus Ryanbacteria bacterium]
MPQDLTKIIEALLFVSGEPTSHKDLARLSGADKKAVAMALGELEKNLKERGVRLLSHKDTYALTTAPEVTDIASKIVKERLEGNLTRSQLEVLAIILWKGRVSRSGIDYIRGVNSSFALRTLLIRGLVERAQDTEDARIFFYTPTVDLLKYLGLSSIKDLPEFAVLDSQLKEYE